MGVPIYWGVRALQVDKNGDTYDVADEVWDAIKIAVTKFFSEEKDNDTLTEIFSEKETRIYLDDAKPVLAGFSKQFPDVLFHVTQDYSNTGDRPGVSYYHFKNGWFRDVTPPFDPLPFNALLMEPVEGVVP